MEIVGPGGVVSLGGPRSRTLFGLLALRAPTVVSRDALIDGIWDTAPPAAAAQTLRAHVAVLRRTLAVHGLDELIETRAPGYALVAPREWVDVHRFEEGLSRGRAAVTSGDLHGAVAHLTGALGLWRGEALAGCAVGEWARAQAIRLRELRHVATEELLATELALGRHGAVAAELEGLVIQNPLRERLWELLIKAQVQAGRRGDALTTYQRARAHLVEELGVEPGPELRRLEAAALVTDHVEPVGPAVLSALPDAPSGVPSPPAPLIGRDVELPELRKLLVTHRLVTLTGPGGCGKTRLAVAVAAEVVGDLADADGARFLDLAPVTEPGLLPGALAAALGVPDDPDRGQVEALSRYLRARQYLLVLDNCEHLVDACAALAGALVSLCPELRILATSREPLRVPGEVVFDVLPLAVPPAGLRGGLAEVRRYEAVQLLLERSTVQTVRALTDDDASALAAICTYLDGLPLAIELVAARTAVLSVSEIADRLPDPALLRAHRYAGHPHHRALDASIGWSHGLLEPRVAARFRRLAVFAGGFTLAAASAVWLDSDHQPEADLDVLADLVAKSLVVVEHRPGGTRYRLLETIRRWVADRLAVHPREREAARAGHAAHFLAEAEEASQWLRSPDAGRWLAQLAADHENLRSASAYYAEQPDPTPGLRLAVALAQYFRLRGRYAEGRQWLRQALAGCSATPASAIVGDALAALALFAFLLGDYAEAMSHAERALTVQRAHADHPATARTLRLLGSVARERGEYERSMAWLDEARSTPGNADNALADVLQMKGFTAWLAGDLTQADQLLHDALNRYRASGDRGNHASTQIHLAACALYGGLPGLAQERATAALATFQTLDVQEGIAWAHNILGLLALASPHPGSVQNAMAILRTSLEVHVAVGDRWRQASVLDALAAAALAQGEATRAAELLGLAGGIREAIGVSVPAIERPGRRRTEAGLRELLSEAEHAAALARGAASTVQHALDELRISATRDGCAAGCG